MPKKSQTALGSLLKQARTQAKARDPVRPRRGSALEERFLLLCRAEGLPTPEREYRFCPDRMWRADFAWPDARLLVEVEGGVWTRGRHTRGAGYVGDLEKYNRATLDGWRVLRYAGDMLRDAPAQIRAMLAKSS